MVSYCLVFLFFHIIHLFQVVLAFCALKILKSLHLILVHQFSCVVCFVRHQQLLLLLFCVHILLSFLHYLLFLIHLIHVLFLLFLFCLLFCFLFLHQIFHSFRLYTYNLVCFLLLLLLFAMVLNLNGAPLLRLQPHHLFLGCPFHMNMLLNLNFLLHF